MIHAKKGWGITVVEFAATAEGSGQIACFLL
jgi:hypothetical protein